MIHCWSNSEGNQYIVKWLILWFFLHYLRRTFYIYRRSSLFRLHVVSELLAHVSACPMISFGSSSTRCYSSSNFIFIDGGERIPLGIVLINVSIFAHQKSRPQQRRITFSLSLSQPLPTRTQQEAGGDVDCSISTQVTSLCSAFLSEHPNCCCCFFFVPFLGLLVMDYTFGCGNG